MMTGYPVAAGLALAALLATAPLATGPANAQELDAMLAGGGEIYRTGRTGAWLMSDRWVLAPDGGLDGVRTSERSASRGITIFEYTPLEGRWWISDGSLCLDDNVSGQLCYRVSPGGAENRPDRFTGVETGSGRATPLFIYPGGRG